MAWYHQLIRLLKVLFSLQIIQIQQDMSRAFMPPPKKKKKKVLDCFPSDSITLSWLILMRASLIIQFPKEIAFFVYAQHADWYRAHGCRWLVYKSSPLLDPVFGGQCVSLFKICCTASLIDWVVLLLNIISNFSWKVSIYMLIKEGW